MRIRVDTRLCKCEAQCPSRLPLHAHSASVVTAARHGGRPLQSIPYEDIIRFKRMRNPETKKQGILFECTPVYGR